MIDAGATPFRRPPGTQLSLLLICAAVIVVSILLDTDTEQVRALGVTLPPLCLFKLLTGWSCPGCGLTRSFVFMGQAMPWEAMKMNVFGPPMWLFLAAQVPYRAMLIGRALLDGNVSPRRVSE